MEDTLIFVDDGFFGLVKKNFQKENGKPKKYLQTFRNICKKENLNLKHLFIYTAPPHQSPKPTKTEDFLMSRYQNMTKMLRLQKSCTLITSVLSLEGFLIVLKNSKHTLHFSVGFLTNKKWITLREGRCQKIINEQGEEEFSQKGIDALIILDMYDFKENYPNIKKIILIASDSDFVPVIERMKQKGIEVILYTYFDRKRHSKFSTSNQLLKVASRWVRLNEGYFEDSKLDSKK